MGTARTRTAALIGATGHMVTVEAEIVPGLPSTTMAGLPDTRETRDRVRAAIINSGERWPDAEIGVSLWPASLPKRGCAFDLAIAVAVMAAGNELPEPPVTLLFLAELGLDGRLRPVPGVLPAVLAAEPDQATVVVAAANRAEASLAPGVTVIAADTLAEVVAWLRGGPAPRPELPSPEDGSSPGTGRPLPDLAGLAGQPQARLAAAVSAAGGHHVSLVGPPGTGKRAAAELLRAVMPPLDSAAAVEVTSIQSAAGTSPQELATVPPFRAPHHTSCLASMIGGGAGPVRPGQVPLAHCGVLLLDQAPEFAREVLDALRRPLESGEVVIDRCGTRAVFPARFILVATAGPCPCSVTTGPDSGGCSCSPVTRRRYLGRLSGPLRDRIDVKVRLQRASLQELMADLQSAEPSQAAAHRVAAARERAAARLAGTPWRLNSEVPGSVLRRSFPPRGGGLTLLTRAVELGQISASGAESVLRVGWTLADLAGRDEPGADHVDLALRWRLGR